MHLNAMLGKLINENKLKIGNWDNYSSKGVQ